LRERRQKSESAMQSRCEERDSGDDGLTSCRIQRCKDERTSEEEASKVSFDSLPLSSLPTSASQFAVHSRKSTSNSRTQHSVLYGTQPKPNRNQSQLSPSFLFSPDFLRSFVRSLTYSSRIIQPLEEGKLGGICRSGRIEGGDGFDDDVGVTDEDTCERDGRVVSSTRVDREEGTERNEDQDAPWEFN